MYDPLEVQTTETQFVWWEGMQGERGKVLQFTDWKLKVFENQDTWFTFYDRQWMRSVSEASDDPNDMRHNETESLLTLKLSNLNPL